MWKIAIVAYNHNHIALLASHFSNEVNPVLKDNTPAIIKTEKLIFSLNAKFSSHS